jgi:hypothetical protein
MNPNYASPLEPSVELIFRLVAFTSRAAGLHAVVHGALEPVGQVVAADFANECSELLNGVGRDRGAGEYHPSSLTAVSARVTASG